MARTLTLSPYVLPTARFLPRPASESRAIQEAHAQDWTIFDAAEPEKTDRALALDPSLHFAIRARSVDQILPLFHRHQRNPVIVELLRKDVLTGAPIVHALGARVLTNVFGADAEAEEADDLSGYRSAIANGADILQGDRPELMLQVARAARKRLMLAHSMPASLR